MSKREELCDGHTTDLQQLSVASQPLIRMLVILLQVAVPAVELLEVGKEGASIRNQDLLASFKFSDVLEVGKKVLTLGKREREMATDTFFTAISSRSQ